MYKSLNILALFILMSFPIMAQKESSPYQKDVQSIDAIMKAFYEVVSGTAEDPWQEERDHYLHSENARITLINSMGIPSIITLEQWYEGLKENPRETIFEVELNREVQQYGNMAQVWSTYEVREKPDEPSKVRGITSLQLYYSEGRWYINSWSAQLEKSGDPIPDKYLGNHLSK